MRNLSRMKFSMRRFRELYGEFRRSRVREALFLTRPAQWRRYSGKMSYSTVPRRKAKEPSRQLPSRPVMQSRTCGAEQRRSMIDYVDREREVLSSSTRTQRQPADYLCLRNSERERTPESDAHLRSCAGALGGSRRPRYTTGLDYNILGALPHIERLNVTDELETWQVIFSA